MTGTMKMIPTPRYCLTTGFRLAVIAFSVAGALGGHALTAQTQPNSCTQRTIPVSIVTESGEPVTDLTAANFAAKFDGKPVPVTSVTSEHPRAAILILLDVSGSMKEFSGSLGGELDILDTVVSQVPPDTPVGIATFSDEFAERIAPTVNRAGVQQEMNNLWKNRKSVGPKGKTAMSDAILRAIDVLQGLPRGSVLYLITDGTDTSSRSDLGEAQSALLSAAVRAFAMIIGAPGPITEDPTRNFVSLIAATGGDAFYAGGGGAGLNGALESSTHSPFSADSWKRQISRMFSFQLVEIANYYDASISLTGQAKKGDILALDTAFRL